MSSKKNKKKKKNIQPVPVKAAVKETDVKEETQETKSALFSGERILKIAGVLLIINAGLAGLLAYYSFKQMSDLDMSAFESLTQAYGQTPIVYTNCLIFSCVLGIFQFLLGYQGLIHANNLLMATRLMVYGGVVLIMELTYQCYAILNSTTMNWSTLLSSLILPIMFIVGAFMNERTWQKNHAKK